MRLIQTNTLKTCEFYGDEIPPYAILSHTWGMGEVSFQDMQSCNVEDKAGYDKVKNCCRIARADGFEYVWVDTCCIDKSSSAELSEAINSMYNWYGGANVCYVYLSDVSSCDDLWAPESTFSCSRWFTRGWTLQELLAPPDVIFFSSDWQEIGTKSSLVEIVSKITGIGREFLSGDMLDTASVAQKMSWASRRQTTRIEDTAYCLMGIFGINMAMLYGEGDRAFIRLQEEIMKVSDDDSIFAWHWPAMVFGGLLAQSPKSFASSGRIEKDSTKTSPFSVTNQGIHLTLPLLTKEDKLVTIPATEYVHYPEPSHFMVLKCHDGYGKSLFTIGLMKFGNDGNYFRVRVDQEFSIDVAIAAGLPCQCILVQKANGTPKKTYMCNRAYIPKAQLQERGFSLCEIYPSLLAGRVTKDMEGNISFGQSGLFLGAYVALRFQYGQASHFVLVLRFLFGERPEVNLIMNFDEEWEDIISSSIEPKSSGMSKYLYRSMIFYADKCGVDTSDRIFKPHPLGGLIRVAIKRQIISRERHYVIDISRTGRDLH